ncbi:MAG: DoxX family protein [Gemmatimonadota bacterium]
MNVRFPAASAIALRVTIAAVFLWHGVPKATDWSFAADKFVGWGLPGWLGVVIGIVETVAAPLLLVGPLRRPAAIVLLAIIVGALATVQIPGGITAGLERDLLVTAGLLVVLAGSARDTAGSQD